MLKRLILIVMAVTTALLAGCGLNNAIVIDNAPVNTKANGLALMSLGYSGKVSLAQNYWIQVSPIGMAPSGKDLMFFASPDNTMFSKGKEIIKNDAGSAVLLAMELPPGEYRVDLVGAFSDTGVYSPAGLKRAPLVPSKFVVKAGEITYLGSALLTRRNDGAAVYAVTDEAKRDLQMFREIRPDIAGLTISETLLSSEVQLRPSRVIVISGQ